MFCGVDEAGRGSVMGPLTVGCVYVEDDSILREIGVKDSKKLSPKVRERMYDQIIASADDYSIVIATAEDIDTRREKISLNDIELDMFREAASKIPVIEVYADCPDVNEMAFSSALSVRMNNTKIIGKHKADDTYPVVSAASIIAKVTRDRMIDDICEEFGVNIGSGYPSDEVTMDFIESWIAKNGRAPKYVRNSWEPVRKLLTRNKNTRITDW